MVRLLDIAGITARFGRAVVVIGLLDIDRAQSKDLFDRIAQRQDTEKPGWVRLNFPVLLDDVKADRIIHAVDDLARNAAQWGALYQADSATARFAVSPANQQSAHA